jgi:DNA-binding transcriptional ArsR family regulator
MCNAMVTQRGGNRQLDEVFAALAHPTRGAILEELSAGERRVGELTRPFRVSRPAISRHLRVLAHAGLLVIEPEGRVRRVHLHAAPLSSAFGWLTQYRVLWEERLDRLDAHVTENERKGTKP